MNPAPPPRLDLRLATNPWYWAAWGAAAFYNTMRDVFNAPLGFLVVFNGTHFFLWGCLGLVAIPFIRRHPIRMHWRPWILHLLAGSLFTLADITLGHWITFRGLGMVKTKSLLEIAIYAFQTCFHLGLMTYGLMIAVIQGLDAQRLSRHRAVQASQLEAKLVQAQLQSLRTQLQPHFLFNTLHSISSLMHYDVPTADRMLTRLSELLRMSLQQFGTQVVPLRQEVAFLEAYLDIEKLRFEHRLSIEWAIPEDLGDSAIPPFLLQPLVENAIKHGIAPRADGGGIVIRAYSQANELLLEVEDDGPGAQSTQAPQPGMGIGLNNTRSRLETLYGADQSFELLRQGRGTIARVRMPLTHTPKKLAA